MLSGELWGFIAAGFALVGSPGPATLSLAAVGAAFSKRDSRAYLLGIMTGVILVIAGVAAGLLTAILAIPYATEVLTVVSVAYLIYLSYKIATAPPLGGPKAMHDPPGYMTGLVLNLSNIKAYAAFTALFSGFDLIPGSPAYSAALEALVSIVIVSMVNIAWLSIGGALQRFLHDPKMSRAINVSFAVLLIASVVAAVALSDI